jgi:hypothetical protein
MVISVALLTDHFSVDDCPRSMVEGSAENSVISGAGAGGGGGAGCTGGGGGGGGGAFFLQPELNATNATRTMATQMTFHFRFNNMISASRIV